MPFAALRVKEKMGFAIASVNSFLNRSLSDFNAFPLARKEVIGTIM
jgi:hypothetical protein